MSQFQNSSTVSWKTKIGRFRGIKTPRLHRVLTEMQGSDSSNSSDSKTVFLFFLSAILKTSRVSPVALCRPGDCATVLGEPWQCTFCLYQNKNLQASHLQPGVHYLDRHRIWILSKESVEAMRMMRIRKPGRPSGMSIRKCRRERETTETKTTTSCKFRIFGPV